MTENLSPTIARVIATLALAALASACGSPRPWNVLLITFDTTRADHLGCYGNRRVHTPRLDRLAAEGVRFANAMTAVPVTAPSHSTILTGRYPIAHGVRDNGLFELGDQQLTLAEILRGHGYATAAAVGAYPVIGRFGFSQGFDHFDDHLTGLFEDYLGQRVAPKERLFFDERRAAQVNEGVVPWLAEHAHDPFFVWVHYFDPHQPFEPPPPYDQIFADDLYAGEISYADACVGFLLDHLERLGVGDRTLVVMVADHGEGLSDHGEETHAVLAYGATLRVPLIVRLPAASGRAEAVGRVVEERVGTVDIVPTILDLLGVEMPAGLQGRSLAPLVLDAAEPLPERLQYAENLSPKLTHGWGELRVLFDGRLKYIHGPRPELYDLEADPGELRDLASERVADVARLRHELAEFLERNAVAGVSTVDEIDPEVRMRLESLGYLHSGETRPTEITETLQDGGIAPQDRVGDINDLSAAKHLLFAGRATDALVYTDKLIRRNPTSAMYRELHATALTELGRLNEARVLVDEQLAEGTVSGPLVLRLVAATFERGERDRAIELLDRFLAVDPTAAAEWLAATLYGRVGNIDASSAALGRALVIDPGFAPARVDLAVRLAESGDSAAAETEFTRSLRDAPYYPKAHYNYGTFLLQHGRYTEAADYFARAVALSPGYVKARLALVAAYVAEEDRPLAERAYEALVQLAPTSPEAATAAALLADFPATSGG